MQFNNVVIFEEVEDHSSKLLLGKNKNYVMVQYTNLTNVLRGNNILIPYGKSSSLCVTLRSTPKVPCLIKQVFY